jgi:hypothetical protein
VKSSALWIVLIGLLATGLAVGPNLWAAPEQDPARQTVPTRTPQSSPTSRPPKAQPTSIPTATVGATPPVASSESLLPQAGGRSLRLSLGLALLVVGLFVIGMIGRAGQGRGLL